ncbi:hypothetical protein [Streptomyces sp. NPDC051776]|uniref:hypothetical protein n=1 Tax=Streptomyces sp. NPDC051776 TaxID=3155414 RepID=UPI0034235406
MNNGQVAAAVVGGYVLGRTRKARLAVTLAAVAAGRGVGGLGKARGLMKTPEVEGLTKTLRGQLVSAGRAAAVNAIGHRVDALSDRLEHGASTLRGEPSDEGEAAESREEEPTEDKRGSSRRETKSGSGSASKSRTGTKKSSSSTESKSKGGSRASSRASDSRGSAQRNRG